MNSSRALLLVFATLMSSLACRAQVPRFARAGSSLRAPSRERMLGASAALSSIYDSKSEISVTTVDLSGRFGWNRRDFEFGPVTRVFFQQQDPLTTRQIEVGAFADWNFAPNVPENETIWGIGAAAMVGVADRDKGAAHFGNRLVGVDVGPFVKWFGFKSSSACLRGDLLYRYQDAGGDVPYATTQTGFVAQAGLQIYF